LEVEEEELPEEEESYQESVTQAMSNIDSNYNRD